MRRGLVAVVVLLALGGCERHRVVTEPDLPPLAAPAPPARVVQPPEPEETPPAAKPPGSVRKPTRPPARGEGAGREQKTVEAPKPPPKPDVPPVREEPPQQPATILQTLPPATQLELERQVKTVLSQAEGDLKRVNYRALNNDAKGQYDMAKRFVEQAQQALKEQNLVLAQKLADKAATILGVLVGR